MYESGAQKSCIQKTNAIFSIYKMHNNQLFDATVTALETGNLSPLVKEELKYTIQSRRLAKGQRELKVDFPEQAKYEVKNKL
jgi:hypothetical protein